MAKRRAHGEGTIRKRADGRWEGRLDLGHTVKSVYGKTQQDVLDKLTQLKDQRRQGINIAPERKTVHAYLLDWVAREAETRDWSASTASYNRRRMQQAVAVLRDTPLVKLTADDIDDVNIVLKKQGVAATTRRNIRQLLRSAMQDAMIRGYVSRNVVALSKPVKVEEHAPLLLSNQQVETLLWHAQDSRLRLAVVFGLLGLRRGEVLGVRWSDVNWDDSTITIAQSMIFVEGKTQRSTPKTKTSARTLPLPPAILAILRTEHTKWLFTRDFHHDQWDDSYNLMVCSTRGTPIVSTFNQKFQALLKRAGLPAMRFHDLRHNAASFLAANGASVKEIMDWLGHASPKMALHYTHVHEQQRRDTAATFDQRFEPKERSS